MQYAAQCLGDYRAGMAEAPAEMLWRAIRALGFTKPTHAARHFGWERYQTLSGIRHHFNGIRGPGKEMAEVYARDLGLSRNRLLGLDESDTPTGNIQIEGKARLGEWLDTDLFPTVPAREKRSRTIHVPRGLGLEMRRAVEVADGSVNNKIREGDFAIYEPIASEEVAELVNGYVYISRRRGSLEERTVRKVVRDRSGNFLLTTDSSDSRYSSSLSYPSNRADETIEILGRVVAQYGPL